MRDAIELFAGVNFLIIGLSHILQHRAWAEFFERLHSLGRPGAFANGFLSLVTGTLIVSLHNIWEWPSVILTAVGWSMVLKAAVVFLHPKLGLRSMGRVSVDRSRKFIVPGALLVAMGVFFIHAVMARQQWL